jgi:four helix bundle protein
MNQYDIYDRVEEFAVNTIIGLEKIPYRYSLGVIRKQVIRPASSIGANLHEADNARSKKEFTSGIGLCLKEIKETLYWFRLLKRTNGEYLHLISSMESECQTIKKILGKIYPNSKVS